MWFLSLSSSFWRPEFWIPTNAVLPLRNHWMRVLPGIASEGQFCEVFWKMCIKCEVQKWQMWGQVYESILETVLPLHRERFVFPFKCACNIMNYTRLDIWGIGQTLHKIQTGFFLQYLDNLDWLVFVELLPGRAMRVFSSNVYEMWGLLQKRKHHIVSKTHNASSNGSTANGI